MPENKNLNLTPEDRQNAISEIQALTDQVSFMAHLLKENNLNEDEANTHMNLIRQTHDSLAKLLGTDVLSRALEESYANCRTANARIHELETRLGGTITAETAIARLRACEDWFCTWYQLKGWHYMSLEYTQYGLKFDMSDEIEPERDNPEEIMFGSRELAVKIAPVVNYGFDGFDVYKDTFHNHILDTQANHEKLEALFLADFPNSDIYEFKSHKDPKIGRMLRASGRIPWSDIENWKNAMVQKAEALPGHNTGKYYAERAELASRLASRIYTKHAGADMIRADRERLAWMRFITGIWDRICRLKDPDDDSKAAGIKVRIPDSPYVKDRIAQMPVTKLPSGMMSVQDINSNTAYLKIRFAGDPDFDTASSWFRDTFGITFGIDIKTDLEGKPDD